jgi:two-component system nitrogen regulation sensor histidine kinase NtrY
MSESLSRPLKAGMAQLRLRRAWARFLNWAERLRLERKLAFLLLAASIAAGTATFLAVTDNLPLALEPGQMVLLLNLDLILLLGLGLVIARRLVVLFLARKKGQAGARLHGRLALLFGLVAVTPTIVVATFSVLLFDFGLRGWFSEKVGTAVKESKAVAEAYLYEHKRSISGDALSIARFLNQEEPFLTLDPERLNRALAAQAGARSLTEAVVFSSAGQVYARAGYNLLIDFDPQIPEWAFRRVNAGEVVILTAETEDRVRALVRLEAFSNAYLYLGRLIDPRVLAHSEETREAVRAYTELEGKRGDLQVTFAMLFVVVALMILLAAIWVGLNFANQLTRPIGRLIMAADRVRSGELSTRVSVSEERDEIDTLSLSFNRMTGELEAQRSELLEANRQLDHRSRFIEAVLGGVSAGVVGLDQYGRVTLPNRSACELLGMAADELAGRLLAQVVPSMMDLIESAQRSPRRLIEGTIEVARENSGMRRLLVRIVGEISDSRVLGFVVTFDDITELASAQRKAAWADVARRIAHEIKNPLTPIQLSAERLKRKYLSQIDQDPESFAACTDIIQRHVADIGRMVDEFSNFARMPAPVIAQEDLGELIDSAVLLQRTAHSEIRFSVNKPEGAFPFHCDAQQFGRVLTNLLKNAVEAIDIKALKKNGGKAEIAVSLVRDEAGGFIEILDNGRGFPELARDRLTEPYVTTRKNGTGLGLAIVKRILEDHNCGLTFKDRPGGGAAVRIDLPDQGDDAHSESGHEKQGAA